MSNYVMIILNNIDIMQRNVNDVNPFNKDKFILLKDKESKESTKGKKQIFKFSNKSKKSLKHKFFRKICNELNSAMSTVSYHCKLNKMGGHSDRLTDEQKMGLQKLYDEIGNLKKGAKLI